MTTEDLNNQLTKNPNVLPLKKATGISEFSLCVSEMNKLGSREVKTRSQGSSKLRVTKLYHAILPPCEQTSSNGIESLQTARELWAYIPYLFIFCKLTNFPKLLKNLPRAINVVTHSHILYHTQYTQACL